MDRKAETAWQTKPVPDRNSFVWRLVLTHEALRFYASFNKHIKMVRNLREKVSFISIVEINMVFCLPESLVFLSENMKPYQLLEKYFV